jgi:hypothetical protein
MLSRATVPVSTGTYLGEVILGAQVTRHETCILCNRKSSLHDPALYQKYSPLKTGCVRCVKQGKWRSEHTR